LGILHGGVVAVVVVVWIGFGGERTRAEDDRRAGNYRGAYFGVTSHESTKQAVYVMCICLMPPRSSYFPRLCKRNAKSALESFVKNNTRVLHTVGEVNKKSVSSEPVAKPSRGTLLTEHKRRKKARQKVHN
jgi:hypothetical protein